MSRAEAATHIGKLEQAYADYKKVLVLDPDNEVRSWSSRTITAS